MLRIRLKKTGTKNMPCFRVVVVDQRCTRDGRTIEEIGFYDPRHSQERLNLERFNHWVKIGAQPTETVSDIARRLSDPETEAKRKAAAKEKSDAAAKEKADAEKKAAQAKAKEEAKEAAAAAKAAKAEEKPAEEKPSEEKPAETPAEAGK